MMSTSKTPGLYPRKYADFGVQKKCRFKIGTEEKIQ